MTDQDRIQILYLNVDCSSFTGANLKTKCTESKVGNYRGRFTEVPESVASSEDCMTACDTSSTCFGWYYSTDAKKCSLSTFVRTYTPANDWIVTGACLGKFIEATFFSCIFSLR